MTPPRHTVITGATRGLGRALALAFAARGDRLAVCARRADLLDAITREVEQAGGTMAVAAPLDLADPDRASAFGRDALAAMGHVDTVIHNASILGPRLQLAAYPREEFDRTLRANVTAPFLIDREIVPSMVARGAGSIVHVSSSVGSVVKPRWGAYLVSKFALEAMSRLLAVELKGTGVRVNVVNPGAMRTDMRREAYPEEDPSTLKAPDEILAVFLYLASDRSAGVTGRRFDAADFQSE